MERNSLCYAVLEYTHSLIGARDEKREKMREKAAFIVLEGCLDTHAPNILLCQGANMPSSIAPNARSEARCASVSPFTPLISSRS